ncbi:MAG: hypothetical protein ACYTG6_10265, partial [Planctomycetota bacterium]
VAPLRRALRHIEEDEHPEYVWTSYYDPFSDIGVVPYVLIAASAAAAAGLEHEARPLLEPALDFLGRVTDPDTGRTVMLGEHTHCYDGHDSTAINAFSRRLLGEAPDARPLALSLASLADAPLEWRAATNLDPHHPVDEPLGAVVNHEFWYHAARAFEGTPGPAAEGFIARLTSLLVANQEVDGEREGSWAPIGVWDRVGGRIYATAMAVRTLAVGRRHEVP